MSLWFLGRELQRGVNYFLFFKIRQRGKVVRSGKGGVGDTVVWSFPFRFLSFANICPWLWGGPRSAAEVKRAVAAAEQTQSYGSTAAAGLLCGWSISGALTLTPAVEALKPRLGFTSHRFAVLGLLYSFPFSSTYAFLTPVLVRCLRQSWSVTTNVSGLSVQGSAEGLWDLLSQFQQCRELGDSVWVL